jgi:hypothetical protein
MPANSRFALVDLWIPPLLWMTSEVDWEYLEDESKSQIEAAKAGSRSEICVDNG